MTHATWPCLILASGLLLAAPGQRVAYDLVVAMVILPAIVWLAGRARPGKRSARWFAVAGAVSYPFYLLHVPAFRLADELLPHDGSTPQLAIGLGVVLALIVTSRLLDRHYDRPVRKKLLGVG